MISELHLENFLFISKLQLSFSDGLNVITGETGAGKSVLLEAVKLLLGKKARAGIVLPGKKHSKIQAIFSIGEQLALKELLEDSGFLNEDDPDNLIISRTFKAEGTGKILVNGIMTTAGFLKQIGPSLMEIHGQNEHQTLLLPDVQRKLLDRCGDSVHNENLHALLSTYSSVKKLQHKLLELEEKNKHSTERINELQENLQELSRLGLRNPEEEEQLKDSLKRLSHSEQILNHLQIARESLGGSDEIPGASALLRKVSDSLRKVAEFDPDIEKISSRANSIFFEVDAIESDITAIAESTDLDPDKLYEVQARLADISRACRKFTTDFAGLFKLQKELNDELSELFAPDNARDKLRQALEEVNRAFRVLIDSVTKKRKELAASLEKRVSKEMQGLGFNSACFQAILTPVNPCSTGAESVEFHVSLNPGAPGGPLRKIASGGELSRVALAIKKELARSDDLPTLVFDEIDAGIGGKTAEAVALSLKSLAQEKQVLLVTHLHQIAKEGTSHFTVTKEVNNNQTSVVIKQVANDERVKEIARMLGHTDEEGMNFARTLLSRTD